MTLPIKPAGGSLLAEAAKQIFGAEPPAWLVHNLGLACVVLKTARDKPPLTVCEMRKQLISARTAAKTLEITIADPKILARIVSNGIAEHWRYDELFAQLLEVQHFIAVTLQTLPAGKGRRGSATAAEISARPTCALFVYESWKEFQGSPPKPTNRKAHLAASALWAASGGPPFEGHANSDGSWRDHFVKQSGASASYRHALRNILLNSRPPP